MSIDVTLLRFPVDTCKICGFDLKGKPTKDSEQGFNEAHQPIKTGFCLKCGYGYAMVEPAIEAPKVEPESPKPITKTVEQLDWPELLALKKSLGIQGQMKRAEIEAAIKEKQNAGA
jgi:hypothetical protein